MARRIRIYELERELGVRAGEIIRRCNIEDIPNPPTARASTVSQGLAATIREWFAGVGEARRLRREEAAREKREKELATYQGQPLLLAAAAGDSDEVQALLQAGCSTDVRSTEGASALHIAAGKGHTDIVRLLLDSGMHVYMPSRVGATRPHDAWVDATPLHVACGAGHAKVVRFLLSRGANVNALAGELHALSPEELAAGYGFTPLHAAVEGGWIAVVRRLIKAGARVNASDSHNGNAPIHLAVGYPDILTLLLDNGADPEQRDMRGMTTAEWADEMLWLTFYGWDSNHDSSSVRESCEILDANTRIPELKVINFLRLIDIVENRWKKPPQPVAEILDKLSKLEEITDTVAGASGRQLVSDLLLHADVWRGKVAASLKSELRRRLTEST